MKSKTSITIEVPSFRPDIEGQADIVEEIVRINGYDKIDYSQIFSSSYACIDNDRYSVSKKISTR